MKITSKREFFELWEKGVLGNRTNLWRNPMDAYNSGAIEIGFREIGKAGGGAWEKVFRHDLYTTYRRWEKLGRNFIMDDGAPDNKRTLSGEICRTYRGLEGSLGVFQMPMREAMAKGLLLPRSGATVLALINMYMDGSSQEDLWALLDSYPDATIEFSCFSVNVGVFPNRNTIFWEIRDY